MKYAVFRDDTDEMAYGIIAIPDSVDIVEVQEYVYEYREEHYYTNRETLWIDGLMEELSNRYGIEEVPTDGDLYF